MMKNILAAFVTLLLLTPANAQKTKAAVQAEITASFPDQTTGAITPAIVRGVFSDFVNSWQQYAGLNKQVGTTYTIAASDYGQIIQFNNVASIAAALPQALGSFVTWNAYVENLGAGVATITPTGSTICGSSTLVLAQYQSAWIVSDGTNYQCFFSTSGHQIGYPVQNSDLAHSSIPINGITCTLGTSCNVGATGLVTVYYNGAWVAQKPDNTFLTTASTTTCAVNEAWTYAAANNLSVAWYGQGQLHPCTTSTTISVPASYGNSFYCYGVYANLAPGANYGILIDTQRYGAMKCDGAVWNYGGSGSAIGIQPAHGPGSISCTTNSTACWAVDYSYELGTVFMNSSSIACLQIDVSEGNGSTQLLSSTFGTNQGKLVCEAQGNADFGVYIQSPSNAYQAGGENQFNVIVEGAVDAELKIGGSSANDPSLGTNHWKGNVAITGSTVSLSGISTNASWDVFELNSFNCYQSIGSQINVTWGTNATNNTVRSSQILACGGGYATDSSNKTNTLVLLPSSLPIPGAFATLPTCAAGTEGWEWPVTDSNTVTWGATIAGSSTSHVLAYCDKSNWTVSGK